MANKEVSQAVQKFNSQEVAVQLQRAPRPKQVSLAEAFVTDYQRSLDETHVRRIVREFDINKVRSPLLAEHPDGGYVIIDGQHTTEALRRKGFLYWPFALVTQMGARDQIDTFINRNNNEKNLKPDEKLHAASHGYMEPGGERNPQFLRGHEIVKGIEDAGWLFKPGHKKARFPVTITLSTGIEEVYDLAEKRKKGTGQEAVTRILIDAQEIWPNSIHISGSPNVHRALGKLLRAYGPLTSDEQLILWGVPATTFDQLTSGKGSQDAKRDIIGEYIIKAVGKRRNKNWAEA